MTAAIHSQDTHQKIRCFGDGKASYTHYHDTEWGVPSYDDQHLFEMLILEGAQAGLSWETVLSKRLAYREAFHQFDPHKVSCMTDAELEDLRQNPNIIRNRLKIYSARKNALAFLKIQATHGSFSSYLWKFVDGKPIKGSYKTLAELPTKTEASERLSCDLKKWGMNFVGPTIMYAYMQAVGLYNDHLMSCWRYPGKNV